MGLTAFVSTVLKSSTTAAVSAISQTGGGVGGPFTTGALIFSLAYLYVLEVDDDRDARIQSLHAAVTISLGFVFACIYVYWTAQTF